MPTVDGIDVTSVAGITSNNYFEYAANVRTAYPCHHSCGVRVIAAVPLGGVSRPQSKPAKARTGHLGYPNQATTTVSNQNLLGVALKAYPRNLSD